MRLCFTSDLHLDQNPEVAPLVAARARRLGADVLVIAGDLGGRAETAETALARLADGARTVLFVPGNHDLWCREHGPTSRDRYLDLLPALCARAGVRYLPLGPTVAAGVSFVGQTGWYDYSLRDPGLEPEGVTLDSYRRGQHGRLAWTDRFLVRWPGLVAADGKVDDEELTRFMDERLAADLAAAPRDRPAVVVTHMLPFAALAPRRPLPWGFVRGFLGARSTGETIARAAAGGLDVRLCISGHTHFARSAQVRAGARRFAAMTRPIGYPREQRRMGFPDLAAMVEHRVAAVDLDVPAHARRAA